MDNTNTGLTTVGDSNSEELSASVENVDNGKDYCSLIIDNLDELGALKIHNDVIQAYSKLNSIALKILYLALHDVQNKGVSEEMGVVRFDIREFLKVIQDKNTFGGKDYEAIKEALGQLKNTYITIIQTDSEDNGSFNYCTFDIASMVRFCSELGFFEIQLNDYFLRYIFKLEKRYTLMLLKNYMKINNVVAMKLYALLYSRYNMTFNKKDFIKKNGAKLDVTVPIETIRYVLYGPNSDKYANDFKYFKRDIINPFIERINEQTDDMHIDEEIKLVRKKGERKASSITFKIYINTAEVKEKFDIQRFFIDMYNCANDPKKEITEEQFDRFDNLFGTLELWRLKKEYADSHENANLYFEATKKTRALSKPDLDYVKKELKRIGYIGLTKAKLNEYAQDLKAREYVEAKGFWKSPTSKELYKRVTDEIKRKEKYKYTAIKDYKELKETERLNEASHSEYEKMKADRLRKQMIDEEKAYEKRQMRDEEAKRKLSEETSKKLSKLLNKTSEPTVSA